MRETYEKMIEALDEIRPELIAEGGDVKLPVLTGKQSISVWRVLLRLTVWPSGSFFPTFRRS